MRTQPAGLGCVLAGRVHSCAWRVCNREEKRKFREDPGGCALEACIKGWWSPVPEKWGQTCITLTPLTANDHTTVYKCCVREAGTEDGAGRQPAAGGVRSPGGGTSSCSRASPSSAQHLP
eukprot:scaffold321552_cov23-Tisochrysis_lutea.AAC.1